MFCRIFLSVLISETIFVASSDNGFLNTVSLENNDTPAKHPTNDEKNANVIRKWLERKNFPISSFQYIPQSNDEENDRTIDVSYRKVANEQTVVFKKILDRWVSLMQNKSKNQIPVLKANDLSTNVLPQIAALNILREGGFVDELSSTNLEQLPIKGNNDILTPANLVSRPWWMEKQVDFLSPENVEFSTETQENIFLLKKENEKQTIALNKDTSNVEKNKSKVKSGSEEMRQLMPIQPISEPWVKQYVISKMNVSNSNGEKHLSTTTENKLRETNSINPSSQEIKVNTESTSDTPENIFQNWGLLIFDSNKNKLIEEEHDQLVNELQKDKKQPVLNSQTLLESAEVDDDRSKVLRQKVETWYNNLRSRRELPNYQNSMPQAVDYRRLLSFWRKELRRQLQIKWNRRPLVEISPGAFKSDIYVNPPDDLAKHMQKLLELKKKQEEKNRDLNA